MLYTAPFLEVVECLVRSFTIERGIEWTYPQRTPSEAVDLSQHRVAHVSIDVEAAVRVLLTGTTHPHCPESGRVPTPLNLRVGSMARSPPREALPD